MFLYDERPETQPWGVCAYNKSRTRSTSDNYHAGVSHVGIDILLPMSTAASQRSNWPVAVFDDMQATRMKPLRSTQHTGGYGFRVSLHPDGAGRAQGGRSGDNHRLSIHGLSGAA